MKFVEQQKKHVMKAKSLIATPFLSNDQIALKFLLPKFRNEHCTKYIFNSLAWRFTDRFLQSILNFDFMLLSVILVLI